MTDRWALNALQGEPAGDGLVRPYLITGGRTRSHGPDLALHTLVGTASGAERGDTPSPEAGAIVEMASTEALSIVDLSARLELAVGVVRVLVGDLAAQGLLIVHDGPTRVDADLVQRLIDGVRSL